MKTWYAVDFKGEIAELSIFDEIGGWGVPVSAFKEDFDSVKTAPRVRVMLNSPGGSVFDGMALYNILSTIRDKLTIEVVGAAASIASVVALAGRELVMGEGSYLMIHNPWATVMGDADELLKVADVLEKMRLEMANIYATRTGIDREEVLKAMAAETWYTAEEAVEAGFADSVHDYGQIAATAVDLSRFRNVPAQLRERTAQARASEAEANLTRTGEVSNHEEAPDMVLSEILEYLGSAKTEDKDAIAKALGVQEARAELTAAQSKIATLEEALAQYKAQAEEQAKAELARRKTAAIESALSDGRILPRDRAKWEARFDEQPDFVEKVLADLPKAIDYSTVGHAGGGNEGDLTPEDVQAMEAMHLNEADYRKFLAAHKAAEKAAE